MRIESNKLGYCQCGCERKTKISNRNRTKYGHLKGKPLRFIQGHSLIFPRRSVEQRFLSGFIKTSNDCWMWIKSLNHNGYGRFFKNGKTVKAHRFSYEFYRKNIPDGLTIDHLCRNRNCVNPSHLEITTIKENIMRGLSPSAINSKKTYCIHGHPFNEKNTYYWFNYRRCRECDRLRKKKLCK